MTKEEFIQISEQEVQILNGSVDEKSNEAWRAGYNYARDIVEQSINNLDDTDFLDRMLEFSGEELE